MQGKKLRKWLRFRRSEKEGRNPDNLPAQKTAALNGQETGLQWIPFDFEGVTLYRLVRQDG